MKLKGVNPFEQHIEKIVLAVVAGIFLIVLAAQLLLQPNMVRIGTSPPVPPARAYVAAKDQAEALRQHMRRSDIELPEVPPVNLADQFLSRREASVSPSPTVFAWGPALQLDVTPGTPMTIGTDRYARLEIPAPTGSVAYSPRSTIDPFEVIATPELRNVLPSEQPYDKAAVSVETRIDGRDIRARLLASGGEDTKPFPAAWWRDGVAVLVVSMEREELTETGEWTNLTVVPSVPGRSGFAERLRTVRSTSDLAELVEDAEDLADQVLRPRYLRTIAGPAWMSPARAAALRPQVRDARIDAMLRQRQQVSQRLEAAHEELAGLEGDRNGAGGARAPAPDQQRRRTELQRQIQGLERQLASIDSDLLQRGYTPPEPEIEPGIPAEARRPLLENSSVQLWAHDLTAQPGTMYRYRISVGINNPAFGRAQALSEDQQDMASRAVLMSPPSEWSAPVQVLDDQYYFIHTAQPSDSLSGARSPARARAEVYKFFYGYFRHGAVQLEPGDVIAAQVKLPEVPLLIWDLEHRRNGEAGPGDPGDPQAEENARPWDQPIFAETTSFLLDVAAVPGSVGPGAQQRTVAYLRGENRGIVARIPEQDRQSEIYGWVLQSAQEGEHQGAPTPEPEAPAEPPPTRAPREPREPREPAPGGGAAPSGG